MRHSNLLALFLFACATCFVIGCGESGNAVLEPEFQEISAEDRADAEAEDAERMAEDDRRD